MSAGLFDAVASDYDAWFESEGRLTFEIEATALRTVLPFLPKPWLEVGVGSGRFAQALGIGMGIDPSVGLLKLAKGRGIEVVLGIAESLPFREGAFGTLFFVVSVCFMASPLAAFREAYRVLEPRGKLVLGMVLRDCPYGRFYDELKNRGHHLYRYASFYSFAEVGELLEQAGFAIDNVVSTLFQRPGEVREMELPRPGFSPEAGFTVVVAGKRL